jgi:hypothetical protein
MSKEIKIEFTWTKELAIEASQKFYEYDMRHSNKRYLGWFFVGLTQFAIVGALKHDSYGLLYLSTFLVGYWYYGRWYLRKSMLEKFYNKREIQAKKTYFKLKEDGLYNENTLIPWDEIFKIIKLDDGILVQIQNNTLFFKREFFSSYEDMQSFLATMKKQGKL